MVEPCLSFGPDASSFRRETQPTPSSIPRVIEDPRKLLRGGGFWIRLQGMIRGGFLSAKERADLTALARNGLAEHRVARRANAILLLDKGWSCEKVAEALLLDDDTVFVFTRRVESIPLIRSNDFRKGAESRYRTTQAARTDRRSRAIAHEQFSSPRSASLAYLLADRR